MTLAEQAVSERVDLAMDGCVPRDMLSYMKSLGVLKAIAERRDEGARGFWRNGDQWVIHSTLDREAALDFFMNEYQPTPIMSPWNKDSGFQPGKAAKAAEALNRIIREETPRFDDWRAVCHESRLAAEEAERRFDKDKDKKDWILRKCRNGFPDSALEWFDAVFVLTDESSGASFPPLFGSGGNDGRFEIGAKFVDCVEQCLLNRNPAESEERLESALFASASPSVKNKRIGTLGFFDAEASGQELINPWDFVLAMEGVLLFAGSASRRLGAGARSYAAFPFMASSSSFAGSQTVSGDESASKSKGELWTPIWEAPASFRDVKILMSEGRAEVGGRQAGNSVDFVRAISGLGVRRGISAFDRYGFLERNGQSRIAAWLDRVPVPDSPPGASNALFDLDQPRRNVTGAGKTSATMKSLGNRLEDAVYRLAKNGGGATATQDVLLRVAEVERYAGKRRDGEAMPPIYGLGREWEREADDGSAEFRLALSLASIVGEKGWYSIRENLEPATVGERGNPQWTDVPKGAFVWNALKPPLLNMAAVLERRCVDSRRAQDVHNPALDGKRLASLEDVIEFLHGRVDERRVGDLALALSMTAMGGKPFVLRPQRKEGRRRPLRVPPAYAAMKLTLLPRDLQTDGRLVSIEDPTRVTSEAALIPLLRAGRVDEAYALASRRLKASTGLGVKSAKPQVADGQENGLRLAAALLFPISKDADSILADAALQPNKETDNEEESED